MLHCYIVTLLLLLSLVSIFVFEYSRCTWIHWIHTYILYPNLKGAIYESLDCSLNFPFDEYKRRWTHYSNCVIRERKIERNLQPQSEEFWIANMHGHTYAHTYIHRYIHTFIYIYIYIYLDYSSDTLYHYNSLDIRHDHHRTKCRTKIIQEN